MNSLDLLNYKAGSKQSVRNEIEYKHFCTKRNLEKTLSNLLGIIDGINADHRIDVKEQKELSNWIEVQTDFRCVSPFDEIICLLHAALEDGVLDSDELEDIKWVCKRYIEQDGRYDHITQALQQLQGELHGISANNTITQAELLSLRNWIEDNDYLSGAYPYDEINSIVTEVMKDGIVTSDEQDLLLAFFGEFIDTSMSVNISEMELEDIRKQHSIQGICAVCPQVEIENHLFCFTGKSSKTSRKKIAEIIEAKGGLFNDQVVAGTQYLVIGNENNSCWAYSCYGRKVERAMEMRKNGASITIVHENDFWDALQA